MKTLDLEKLWSVCNTLSNKESDLCEQDIFVHLMGHRSDYGEISFEGFLNYYSFRVDGDDIVVFNDDGVPYESCTNSDFSYIPICLLYFSAEQIDLYMEGEIENQLEKQKRDKLAQKENIKEQIKRLETQLNNL